jgi:DHA1 family tetracycline resistance protein-like MFS transporter
LLGGLLGEKSLRLPFIAAGVVTLANWLYGFFVLPESLGQDVRRKFSWKRANPLGSFLGLTRNPVVLGLAVALFLMNLGQFGVHNTWVLYTGYRFQWKPSDVGISLAVVGITAAIVQGGLSRVIIPAMGERRALTWGFFLNGFTLILYGLATKGWMIYAILPFGAVSGIGAQAGQGIVSRSVGPDEQGSVQGALAGLNSVAAFVAPLVATNLFGYFIGPKAPMQLPGIPFFLGATLVFAGLVVAIVTLKRVKFQV